MPEDIGYGLVAWAGQVKEPFGLTISFGSTNKWVFDRVTLKFPADRRASAKEIDCVLRSLVESWEPDWAAFNPVEHKGNQLLKASGRCYIASGLDEQLPCLGEFTRTPFGTGYFYDLADQDIARLYAQLVPPVR